MRGGSSWHRVVLVVKQQAEGKHEESETKVHMRKKQNTLNYSKDWLPMVMIIDHASEGSLITL